MTLLLALPALVAAISPTLATALQYDRGAVAAGEGWRLLSSHWVHWSPDHLLWDLGAFLGLGALCELRDRRSYLVCLLVSVFAIGLGVHWFQPQLSLYRGLSGLDSALLVLLAVSLLMKRRGAGTIAQVAIARSGPALALVLFAAKVVFELNSGGAVFVKAEGLDIVVVPLAHVLGGLVGVLVAVVGEVGCYIADHVEAPGTHQTLSAGSPLAEL